MFKRAILITIMSTQLAFGADFNKGSACLAAGDVKCALKEFSTLAEQGDAEAQTMLGLMYSEGAGVKKSDTEAVKWLRRAAQQGEMAAQGVLGFMYESGRGVKQNYAWALYWTALSAQQGASRDAIDGTISSCKKHLNRLSVQKKKINIRSKPTTKSAIVGKAGLGETLYRLNKENGWYEVYAQKNHVLGYVAESLVIEMSSVVASNSSSPYPPRPAAKPGYITCNTKCFNGDCYRTYSDGEQVRFQARRKYNPMSGQFEFDSGGC